MNNQIILVPVEQLLAHERVSQKRVHELMRSVLTDNELREPILVSREHNIVLDGHHRLEALKRLGARYIPAYLIDYYSQDITVTLRRNKFLEIILKKGIIAFASEGKLFPYKTTRHTIKERKKNYVTSFDSCK